MEDFIDNILDNQMMDRNELKFMMRIRIDTHSGKP